MNSYLTLMASTLRGGLGYLGLAWLSFELGYPIAGYLLTAAVILTIPMVLNQMGVFDG